MNRKNFRNFYEDDEWSKPKDSKRYDRKRKSIQKARKKKRDLRNSMWMPKR